MRIDGEVPKIPGVYNKNKTVNRISSSSGAKPKKDVVSISGSGKDYHVAQKAVREKPDIRQEKVNEISRKIESGTYDVSGKEVAGKIIDSIINKKA